MLNHKYPGGCWFLPVFSRLVGKSQLHLRSSRFRHSLVPNNNSWRGLLRFYYHITFHSLTYSRDAQFRSKYFSRKAELQVLDEKSQR